MSFSTEEMLNLRDNKRVNRTFKAIDETNPLAGIETRRRNRRGELLDLVVQIYDRKNKPAIKAARKEILVWNGKNPQRPINLKSIIQARRGRAKIEDRSTFGVRETSKNKDLIDKFNYAN
jgi:hypothetical protein